MKCMVILCHAIFLSGCASLPLGSLIELRTFGADDFMRVQAKDIRIKILVDEPVHADVERTHLTLEAATQKGKRRFHYPLSLINTVKINPRVGLLTDSVGKTQYTLKLSDEGQKNLIATQQTLQDDKSAHLNFTVKTGFEKLPADLHEIGLTVLLMFSEQKGFITLFDNAKLSFRPVPNK